jgi:hypothetical protein
MQFGQSIYDSAHSREAIDPFFGIGRIWAPLPEILRGVAKHLVKEVPLFIPVVIAGYELTHLNRFRCRRPIQLFGKDIGKPEADRGTNLQWRTTPMAVQNERGIPVFEGQ